MMIGDPASNLFANANGSRSLDSAAPASVGFDRAKRQDQKWAFTGTVGGGTDQAPYYNVLTDTAQGSATLGAPTFSSSALYSAASATRFIADNPAPLELIQFTGAAGTLADSLLARGQVQFVRFLPDGSQEQKQIELSTYVTAMRFDKTTIQLPIDGEVLDGYTYVRIFVPQGTPTASSYAPTFCFGATIDRRAEVPAGRAKKIVEPGIG